MIQTPFEIDPDMCRVWSGQPRPAGSLNTDSCADLIDSLRAQTRQEIPAIVRPLPDSDTHRYEIICGARRQFAVRHLRAQGLEIGFLIAPRELSDEAAFRIADLENRARADISAYDRARAYALALDRYYDGVQARMADRMRVSPAWLSRMLQMARLPQGIMNAIADPGALRERHARIIGALLAEPATRDAVLEAAAALPTPLPAPQLVRHLQTLGKGQARLPKGARQFRRSLHDRAITMQTGKDQITLRMPKTMTEQSLRGALDRFLAFHFR